MIIERRTKCRARKMSCKENEKREELKRYPRHRIYLYDSENRGNDSTFMLVKNTNDEKKTRKRKAFPSSLYFPVI